MKNHSLKSMVSPNRRIPRWSKNWKVGLKVAVFKGDDKKFMGYGTITNEMEVYGVRSPKITFDSTFGKLKTIFGYECWWLPRDIYEKSLAPLQPKGRSSRKRSS